MNGTLLSDTTTKIFEIREPSRSLAYAFGGSVALTDKDDPQVIRLDFRDEATKVIHSLAMSVQSDLLSYAKRLSRHFYRVLVKAQKSGNVEPFKGKSPEIVNVFLAGYYAKIPSAVTIQFRHQNQILLDPLVDKIKFSEGYSPSVIYGSKKVAETLFQTDDPRLASYRVPKRHEPSRVTIAEVADIAQKYISACGDPAGIDIDPNVCAAIGGHVHMAKVTPKDGFSWLPEYGPVAASAAG